MYDAPCTLYPMFDAPCTLYPMYDVPCACTVYLHRVPCTLHDERFAPCSRWLQPPAAAAAAAQEGRRQAREPRFYAVKFYEAGTGTWRRLVVDDYFPADNVRRAD